MTKDQAIDSLVAKVEELNDALLNATEMFEEDEQYTLDEHEEVKNLCAEAKALIK